MNADNFVENENWTVECNDTGPSASEGERQGRREHKRRSNLSSGFLLFISVHPRLSAVSKK
jgi:hypothetical protein